MKKKERKREEAPLHQPSETEFVRFFLLFLLLQLVLFLLLYVRLQLQFASYSFTPVVKENI